MEHVGCRQDGLSRFIEARFRAQQVAIAAENGFCLGIPDDELLVGILHGVEFIKVQSLAGATTSSAEGYLAQTTNLAEHVGSVLPCDDIHFVVALVGESQTLVLGELAHQDVNGNRGNDLFHVLRTLLCYNS